MSDYILLTTDFSDCAAGAVPWAAALSRALGLPIQLLHVIDTLTHQHAEQFQPRTEWDRHLAEVTEQRLQPIVDSMRDDGLEVQTVYRPGVPADEILRALEGAAVGVISTHGYGLVGRLLMGSVATKVMRQATKPLLVVSPESTLTSIDRVLFPVARDTAAAALPAVARFTRAVGAKLRLMHVVTPPLGGDILGVHLGQGYLEQINREIYEDAHTLVADLKAAATAHEVETVSAVVTAGRVAAAIG